VGLRTGAVTPSACSRLRAQVVLPLPSSPRRCTTAPEPSPGPALGPALGPAPTAAPAPATAGAPEKLRASARPRPSVAALSGRSNNKEASAIGLLYGRP